MKVSGFSIIRNAVLMGYPIVESIQSILPIVDEFVIGVGQSDDSTLDLIESIQSPKIRVFKTYWDTQKTKGGLILSEKTNQALAQCAHDWCFYLQAYEVVHEKDLANIYKAMERSERDPEVQGLLFRYIHFYGSHHIVATSRKWYRNEIRIVKKSSSAQSVSDAQGFRINGEKLKVKESNASIYHYGWVKPPKQMGQKSKLLNRWWHGNKLDQKFDNFEYDHSYGLKRYTGSHPAVMRPRVEQQDWNFEPHRTLSDWTLKDLNLAASDLFERMFRYRIGEYKPYRLLK